MMHEILCKVNIMEKSILRISPSYDIIERIPISESLNRDFEESKENLPSTNHVDSSFTFEPSVSANESPYKKDSLKGTNCVTTSQLCVNIPEKMMDKPITCTTDDNSSAQITLQSIGHARRLDSSKSSKPTGSDDDFHLSKYETKKLKRKETLIGMRQATQNSKIRAGPPPRRNFYVSRLIQETSESDMFDHLMDRGIRPVEIKDLTRDGNT